MDARHPVELIHGGVRCLQLTARKLLSAAGSGVRAQCPSIAPSRHGQAHALCQPCLPGFTRGEIINRLFHDQIIFYGFDPFDAACDLTRFIDRLLRANEAAELNAALVSLDTDRK